MGVNFCLVFWFSSVLCFCAERRQTPFHITVVSFMQTMTDVTGNPEEERHCDFYDQPWSHEAVCRYFYGKVSNCTTVQDNLEIQLSAFTECIVILPFLTELPYCHF